jgi:hypothetical protein
MPSWTLRVLFDSDAAWLKEADAERRRRHSHAEHGNEFISKILLRRPGADSIRERLARLAVELIGSQLFGQCIRCLLRPLQ